MSNTKQAQTLTKQAVDAEAERYWEEYYKDSGYGKLWTREIPKRVQAELQKRQASASSATKTAAKASTSALLRPLATVITADRVHLEGFAVSGEGEGRQVQAFVVDFDHEGRVHGFDAVTVR
jgi:hypothetical protein